MSMAQQQDVSTRVAGPCPNCGARVAFVRLTTTIRTDGHILARKWEHWRGGCAAHTRYEGTSINFYEPCGGGGKVPE